MIQDRLEIKALIIAFYRNKEQLHLSQLFVLKTIGTLHRRLVGGAAEQKGITLLRLKIEERFAFEQGKPTRGVAVNGNTKTRTYSRGELLS
jgi:hypothetical protein